jgi:hypothetical protein
MAADLKYVPIQELIGTLTLDGVLEFEKELVTSGWNVFVCNFLKLALHDNFLKFRENHHEQQTDQETGADSGGSAETEHV